MKDNSKNTYVPIAESDFNHSFVEKTQQEQNAIVCAFEDAFDCVLSRKDLQWFKAELSNEAPVTAEYHIESLIGKDVSEDDNFAIANHGGLNSSLFLILTFIIVSNSIILNNFWL